MNTIHHIQKDTGGLRIAQTRDGTIHILDPNKPNKSDPWKRSLCGDPGDFMEFNKNCTRSVTCKSCLLKSVLRPQISRPLKQKGEEMSTLYEQEQIALMNKLMKLSRAVVRNEARFDDLKVHCTFYHDGELCMHLHRADDECAAISCSLGGLSEKEWKKLGVLS